MPHHVYANGNEIATKSSDGKSAACFPDVCFSPPTPPASGVPIPYANTCFAKDITNGSKTVIIGGAEVALENHSYFASSVGDAPATKALKKGIRSGNINGKGFFQTWSQNVKVEGMGVCRHMDSVTHNHTNSGNTVPNKFISRADTKAKCKSNMDTVKLKCKDINTKSEQKKKNRKKNKILSLLTNIPSMMDDKAKKLYGYKRNNNTSWMDDHCEGLWVKPTGSSTAFKELKQEMDDLLALGKIGIMQKAAADLIVLAYNTLGLTYLAKEIGILGAKALVKNLVGAAAASTGVGLTVTAGMAAWTASDMIRSANNIAKRLNSSEAQQLSKLIADPKLTLDKLAKQKADYETKPVAAVADMMTIKATTTPCIKSRRCLLVPFNKTNSAANAAKTGEGCCPGQTGHHIMPKAMFTNACTAYTESVYGKAPTICLEGATQHHGSHGDAHLFLNNLINDYKKEAAKAKNSYNNKMSYIKARDISVKAIRKVASHCDAKCLKLQLDEHHAMCKDKELNAKSGK